MRIYTISQKFPTQEYEKYSKYLNKGSVDAYKEKKEREEKQKEEKRKEKEEEQEDEELSHKKRKKERKEKDRDADRHDDRSGEKHHSHTNGHSSAKTSAVVEEGIASLWPHLRVRIISRSFKGGKYYSSKGKLDFDKLCTPGL